MLMARNDLDRNRVDALTSPTDVHVGTLGSGWPIRKTVEGRQPRVITAPEPPHQTLADARRRAIST